MFETVVPESVAPRSRKLFYEILPVSLALHAIAGGALLATTLWTVVFPTNAPKFLSTYQLIATPPPPPPPPPLVRRTVVPDATAVTIKLPDLAPTIIPDTIPQVLDLPYVDEPVLPAVASDSGHERGVEGGVEGGEIGGQIGGIVGGLLGAPAPEVVEIKRDAPLPVGAISQEFPAYPERALKRSWEDVLIVRYVIGKDGRVKEVTILDPPEREEFAREALSKIRHWRFHPYIDENGDPKEVAHELTVEFKLFRKAQS